MKKTIHVLQEEFAEIRAGRANPNVLVKLQWDYYGAPTPINQLAAVSVSESKSRWVIQPWDASSCGLIEKGNPKVRSGASTHRAIGKNHPPHFPTADRGAQKGNAKDISKMSEQAKVSHSFHPP